MVSKSTARAHARRSARGKNLTLHWDDLPLWMQVDPYIRSGYRRQLNSFPACFSSLFYAHNDLVNTWSHLLPALFYFAILVGIERGASPRQAQNMRPEEGLRVTSLYATGTGICLLLSVSVCFARCFVFSSSCLFFPFFFYLTRLN